MEKYDKYGKEIKHRIKKVKELDDGTKKIEELIQSGKKVNNSWITQIAIGLVLIGITLSIQKYCPKYWQYTEYVDMYFYCEDDRGVKLEGIEISITNIPNTIGRTNNKGLVKFTVDKEEYPAISINVRGYSGEHYIGDKSILWNIEVSENKDKPITIPISKQIAD